MRTRTITFRDANGSPALALEAAGCRLIRRPTGRVAVADLRHVELARPLSGRFGRVSLGDEGPEFDALLAADPSPGRSGPGTVVFLEIAP